MDNSVSKALIIVASVLLAMIVIAFVVFSFRRVGTWAVADNQKGEIAQRDKFNKEYEVYDKDLMYGVDVISCLNKALANNDKIDNKYGEKVDAGYEIQVELNLDENTKLQEKMIVSYTMRDDKGKIVQRDYTNNEGPNGYTFDVIKSMKMWKSDYFKGTSFRQTNSLKTSIQNYDSTETKTKFLLTANGNGINEDELRSLLSLSTTMKETIKNPDNSKTTDWSTVVFESALYDLKTRKFKCKSLNYDTNTGRVSEIVFQEIL